MFNVPFMGLGSLQAARQPRLAPNGRVMAMFPGRYDGVRGKGDRRLDNFQRGSALRDLIMRRMALLGGAGGKQVPPRWMPGGPVKQPPGYQPVPGMDTMQPQQPGMVYAGGNPNFNEAAQPGDPDFNWG